MPDTEHFRLSPQQAHQFAQEFGTPLYVVGETHFRDRLREYKRAAFASWPNSELCYASKANSTLAVLAIVSQEGYKIDVASEGEFRCALAAGVPAHSCSLHGNNKSEREIQYALEQGVGKINVDNFAEIELLKGLDLGNTILHLRLAPGVAPKTDGKISTGQSDTKFGFSISDGAALHAARLCVELGLPLKGIHCHVGSQLLDPDAQLQGAANLVKFALEVKRELGVTLEAINVGGGLGIDYGVGKPWPVSDYCSKLAETVTIEANGELPDLKLIQEPGRSLVGQSGVTLYTIGVRKKVPERTYLSVDGGLSDNPRPAMYGSVYPVESVGDHSSSLETYRIAGKHCETDTLFDNVQLPSDLKQGDLLQVLCTGAYNSSMSSNYNRFLRPATVLLRSNGNAEIVQERETFEQLLQRERLPESWE